MKNLDVEKFDTKSHRYAQKKSLMEQLHLHFLNKYSFSTVSHKVYYHFRRVQMHRLLELLLLFIFNA